MSTLETHCPEFPTAPAASATPSVSPFVSVIMPVRNEAAAIANTLGDLLRQRYARDRFEIIVVDGESTDNTREIVQEIIRLHTNVRLLTNPRRWSSAARNLGVQAARGELILIVDGHCDIGSDHYLDDLVAAFARTGADCLGRPQPLETSQASTLQQAIGIARASRLGHHPASHVFATNEQTVPAHSVAVAYRREVFDRVGLFDESFDACEDVELNHRVDLAGMRCVVVPALRVAYHPRATLRRLFQQMFRYGRGRLRLLRKHPETFSPLGFAPAAFWAFLIVGLGLACCSKWFALIYGAIVTTYLMTVVGYSCLIAYRYRRGDLAAWLPAIFVTLHAGAGAGVIRELFRLPAKRGMQLSPAPDSHICVRGNIIQKLLLIGYLAALGIGRAQTACAKAPHTQEYLQLQSMLEQMKNKSAPKAVTPKKANSGPTAQSTARPRGTNPYAQRPSSKPTRKAATFPSANSAKQTGKAPRNGSARQTAQSPSRNRVSAQAQAGLAMPTQVQTYGGGGNNTAQQYEAARGSRNGGMRRGR